MALTKAWKDKFLSLDNKEFTNLCRLWVERNVDLELKHSGADGYEGWLNYFKTITPQQGRFLIRNGQNAMDIEAYAALSRWYEIIANPNKIDKLYKAQLDKKAEEDIMEVAIGEDDEEFYKALIQKNVHQLQSSSVSQQETARLTANINIFRKELKVIRSRTVKKGTVLANILEEANRPKVDIKKPVSNKKPIKEKDAKTNLRKSKA